MNNKKSVLGLDLGTSSVKVLQLFEDGNIIKEKEPYESISPKGWWKAISNVLDRMELESVVAIGLSSQVGTYIVDEEIVIPWDSDIGYIELADLKKRYSISEFVQEISMPHPNIASYPMPRLRYIKNVYPDAKRICQPKDYICEKLTGNYVTDPYSWRGLAHLEKKQYSTYFLQELGIDEIVLPKMMDYKEVAGYTKEGIPVYVGLNDYYASLLGMGIQTSGDMFDITGTSEHLGVIQSEMSFDTELVCGPYLKDNVHYGVTASSGASLNFGLQLSDGEKITLEAMSEKNPPIFLPYLNGERAPIWDGNAKGMFFGISGDCTKDELTYSVLEGVAFSVYHIYESMGKPAAIGMKVAGGAAVNNLLNQIKAEVFEIPVFVLEETDTSALGAAILAAVGIGFFDGLEDAIEKRCNIDKTFTPTGKYTDWLHKRFELYKELYPAVKTQYEKFRRMEK